jgi:hypothetical protein
MSSDHCAVRAVRVWPGVAVGSRKTWTLHREWSRRVSGAFSLSLLLQGAVMRCLSVVVVGLVAGLVGFAPAPKKVQSADYYPLEVGTTWTYQVGGQTMTSTVAKHEKVGDVLCARVEASLAGMVVATEHVSVDKDGVYRHTSMGKTAKPPARIIKLPFKKGDTWKYEGKVGDEDLKVDYTADEEEVTVPAGKYKAIVTKTSEFETGGVKVKATIWYAKGVGMVKTEMTVNGSDITIELEKFKKGK